MVEIPRTAEELRLWNASQLFLIQYQLRRGLIKTIQEYEEFVAPAFELVGDRHIEVDPRDSQEIIDELREQLALLQAMVSKPKDQIEIDF